MFLNLKYFPRISLIFCIFAKKAHLQIFHPSTRFLMILPCDFSSLLRKINLEHAFKALFVPFSMIWAPAPKHAPRHPQFCIKKPLEGWQNSRVPRWFSLFGNVADFATPPYVFKVFRSPFWPLWAPTSHNFMISSWIVTFFAYKYKPDLDRKGEVRKGHAKAP